MSARSEIVFGGTQRQRGLLHKRATTERDNFSVQESGLTISPLLFALHIPLGVLLYSSIALEIAHPIAVTVIGLYWASQRNVPIVRTAYVVAYLIGVEVLWRMVEAPVYWEFGKYGAAVIMIVALVRRGLFRMPGLPLLYLILLIPACFVTVYIHIWKDASNKVSFNMSGPFCLFASCWFFSHIKLSQVELKKLLLYVALPLISIAVATLFFTVTNPNLQFTNESNFATSGGFGPNQVSSVLGLGMFIAVAALVSFNNTRITSALLAGLALFFATQSVLTFSRGGVYASLGALAVLAIFQARNLIQFLPRFLPVLIIGGIFVFLVFPSLNDFTDGKLEERFQSNDTASRVEIMEQEVHLFSENPIFGVGVGRSIYERYLETQHAVASHTEFTRVLSEHGLLGVLAMIFLTASSFYNIRTQPTRTGKALSAGLLVWAALCMANTGMRIAAPAFVWGLSFAIVFDSARRARSRASAKTRLTSAPVGLPRIARSDTVEGS